MPVLLKKDEWRVKDPLSGNYTGAAILSTTLPEDAAQIVENTQTALNSEELRAEQIINNTQNAVDGINSQSDMILESISKAIHNGTDTTLEIEGMPADAKATGNLKKKLMKLPAENDYGENGQYPRSTGSGIEWVDYGLPSDEQTTEAIQSWLNAHPEATTTVQDNSLTNTKYKNNSITQDKCDDTLKALLSIATNIEYLGVNESDTPQQTLQKINNIIENTDLNLIIIPPNINYGYKKGITRPNTSLAKQRLIIFDFSRDMTYGADESHGYQAMNMRIWFKTAPNEDAGYHDGNGIQINSAAHPHIILSANQQGDTWVSKRASLFFASNDIINWQIGQGIYSIDETHPNGDTDFYLTRFIPGSTTDTQMSLVISHETGNMGIGGNNLSYPLGIINRFPVIIKEDGKYLMVKSAHNNPLFILEKQAYAYGEWTYFKSTKCRESNYEGSQTDTFYRNGQPIRIGYNTSNGFTITNLGATEDLFILKDTGKFKYGVSGSHYTSSARPIVTEIGTMIFDTTLNKPIWWDGTKWVDANGTGV